MDQNALKFFIKNAASIDALIKAKTDLDNFISQRVGLVKSILPVMNDSVSVWIYRKYILVYDFKIQEHIVAVDIRFQQEGIELIIWIRYNTINYQEFLPKLEFFVNNPIENFTSDGEGVKVILPSELPLLTPPEDIAKRIEVVLGQIVIQEMVPVND